MESDDAELELKQHYLDSAQKNLQTQASAAGNTSIMGCIVRVVRNWNLKTAVHEQCTEGFTDGCYCGRKYFYKGVYCSGTAELE